MPEWIPIVLSFIGGLGGVATLGTWILSWRKAKPEIARMYQEMLTTQAQEMKRQADDLAALRKRVSYQDQKIDYQGQRLQRQGKVIRQMEQRLEAWEEGIRKLVRQLSENGLEPIWMPDVDEVILIDDDIDGDFESPV